MTTAKRTLLVLGGSSDQLFLIRSAQELGLAVLCLDQNGAAPGFAEAEESVAISTRDVPAILSFLEQRQRAGRAPIAGVLTMGSEIPEVLAAVAERFHLAGPAPGTAHLASDKFAMKQRFAECGVPIPWFAEVRTLSEVRAHLAVRPQLVLKPVDRSGSRGVFVLDPSCDVAELYRRAREFSYCGRVQVEEYLDGPQISTETVLWDARAVTPGFADRNYELLERFHPQVMENGGWLPSRFSGSERKRVEEVVERAARALGITRGVAKGDVVFTAEGPKVIEIAARLSGGDLCESIVPLSSGVNYVRSVIRIALGEEPDWRELEPKFTRHVSNRYFFPPPGRLLAIEGADKVRAQPWVKKLAFAYQLGDVVPPATSHATRAGVFVVVAEEREALERRIAWVYRTLRLVTESDTTVRAAS